MRRHKLRRLDLRELEPRLAPANVTTYHNDIRSTGVNSAETMLTRSNVNWTSFGKQFTIAVDGQVYAQPLVVQNVNITTGANQGVHDVVFVATQHDTLYAIDAVNYNTTNNTGIILWQRSFLDTKLPGATANGTMPAGDSGSSDITVEIGITGTPVIDAAANKLYVIPKQKETVSGIAHYTQRLHCVSLSNGTDAVTPFLISDTAFSGGAYTNNTKIYVYGTGDGNVTDPYNGTGQKVVQFNAMRQHQRPALTLINGVVYAGWASHGDNGPYHGWMVGFDANDLHLRGALNTTPNGGLGGIWMAGGALTFDGTYFYFETGNGTFTPYNGAATATNPVAPAPGPLTGLNAQGFPNDACYGDSFVKVALDPTTTPVNQNVNGWGLKVVDYFTPFNEQYLDQRDLDVGSAACLVLPDSVGSAAHPHLLIGSGKEGVIYLIDRDNMGKFGLQNNIVQNTANQLSGSLDTACYFQGRIYYVEGYGGTAKTFTISNGMMSLVPETRSLDSFAFAGSTPSISANGTSDGIVWDIDRGTNQLRAYSSDSYATELYTSAQAPGNRDAMGAAVKFQVPTVVNGHVYVGSGTGAPNNFLVVYGLVAPPTQVPAAPSDLMVTPVSTSQINLTWTNHDVSPNIAESYFVERSPDGSTNWQQIATVSAGNSAYSAGGLTANTTYFFRVRAHNSIGNSAYTNIASGTTPSTSNNTINYPTGFTGAGASFTLLGGATIQANGRLRLTSSANNQVRAAWFNTQQTVTAFSTTFTYTKTGQADGLTLTFQRDSRGLAALGGGGGSLGYGTANQITPSFAVAINIYNGHPYGTELLTNGNVDFNYDQSKINTSLDNTPIQVTVTYTPGNLTATFTQAGNMETKNIAVDLPTLLGGNTAWVGFTAATGGLNSTQEITNWTYTPVAPPAMPTNLQAVVTGYTAGSIVAVPLGAHLTWTAAAGASGYKIESRLTGAPNWTEIGTSDVTSFDDSGLATQQGYDYRVRAHNAAGDGAYSTITSITTPALAPTPTGGVATAVTTTSVSLQWMDNATNEDGFQIFRSINNGAFTLLTSRPLSPGTGLVTYTDMTNDPGTHYDYHVQAFNLAGYSDFSGISTSTLALAPTGLAATFTGYAVDLTWTASAGADSYKVYRATNAGGPYTLLASGLTMTTFSDPAPNAGTNYYQVTAVNLGGEGAPSNTALATATPPAITNTLINDVNPQRSRVTALIVTFSRIVTFAGAPAAGFELTGPLGVVPVTVSLAGSTATETVAQLTFPLGASVEFNSLVDGQYQLRTIAGQISAAGLSLDGDANGTPGGDGLTSFHRLFGDVDGDGDVDTTDFGAFRGAYGASSFAFDFDGDGDVDTADFGAFRQRFGVMI